MKLTQPYKCDYCPNVKTASNHWFLSIGDGLQFRLIPWDDIEADRGSVRHVCSESCAVKSLNKYFEGRSEQPAAPVSEQPYMLVEIESPVTITHIPHDPGDYPF